MPPQDDTSGQLLEVAGDQVWHAQQLLRFGPLQIATRMTVARLVDGGLWVHSPVTPTESIVSALGKIGVVRHIVAPNRSHHLFFLSFARVFPQAQGWIAPGLAAKHPDLASYPELHDDVPWAGELQPFFIRGIPLINETAWFHVATGTLVLTDLLFCIGPNRSLLVRSAARALGIYGRLGMSRTMKLAVRDRAALAGSVAPLLSLPVQRVVVAHDQIVGTQARQQLQRAFEWLQ